MACLPIPLPPDPKIQSPLTVTPPSLPSQTFPINACCRLPPIVTPALTPPFPPLVLDTLATVLEQALDTVTTVLRSLSIPCPREA